MCVEVKVGVKERMDVDEGEGVEKRVDVKEQLGVDEQFRVE